MANFIVNVKQIYIKEVIIDAKTKEEAIKNVSKGLGKELETYYLKDEKSNQWEAFNYQD